MPVSRKTFNSIEEAIFDIQNIVQQYLATDGITWIVGKLKSSIIRTVYSRKISEAYNRTGAFKESVRGRFVNHGKHGNSWNFELMAFPDDSLMEPHHTSWVSGNEFYGNKRVDHHISEWLDKGHGGMGVRYKPAKFIEKTEQTIKDPKGLIRGIQATLRKNGYKVLSYGDDFV